jgi:hypothetical protein
MTTIAAQQILETCAFFGKPRIQRYKVNDRVRLSAECLSNGMVSAIEIAPSDRDAYDPLKPLELSRHTVDQVFGRLLPGIVNSPVASETVIRGTWKEFVREVRRLSGVTLNCDYPLGEAATMMHAASLVFGDSDFALAIETVTSILGDPDYQQFEAGGGLAIKIFFRSRDSIQSVVIGAGSPLLIHREYPTPIDPHAAEILFDQLIPQSARGGKPLGMVCIGALTTKHELHGEMLIYRQYVSDDMIGIGASWPQ